MEYSRDHAEVYDFIFRNRDRGKDWGAEADDITGLVRQRFPAADSLLDVACGTGGHLETFAKRFRETAGVELSRPMVDIARERLPGVPIHVADLRDFRLGRRFDAVTCLFCPIGYMRDTDELDGAIARMAEHLVPGGVLVVEPWWFPDRFIEGYANGDIAREPGRVVARVTRTERSERASRLEVRFVVADATGIRTFTVTEAVSLFTREEYESAFHRAGCTVEYLDGRLGARGLFVAVRQP